MPELRKLPVYFALATLALNGMTESAPQLNLNQRAPKPGGYAYGLSQSSTLPSTGATNEPEKASNLSQASTTSSIMSTKTPSAGSVGTTGLSQGELRRDPPSSTPKAEGGSSSLVTANQEQLNVSTPPNARHTEDARITNTGGQPGRNQEQTTMMVTRTVDQRSSPTGDPSFPTVRNDVPTQRSSVQPKLENVPTTLPEVRTSWQPTFKPTVKDASESNAEGRADTHTASRQSTQPTMPAVADAQSTGRPQVSSAPVPRTINQYVSDPEKAFAQTETPKAGRTAAPGHAAQSTPAPIANRTQMEGNVSQSSTSTRQWQSTTVQSRPTSGQVTVGPLQRQTPAIAAMTSQKVPESTPTSNKKPLSDDEALEDERASSDPKQTTQHLPLEYLQVLCNRGITSKIERTECQDCIHALERTIAAQPASSTASSNLMRLVAMECLADDATREAMEACVDEDPDRLHSCAEEVATQPKNGENKPEDIPPDQRQPASFMSEEAKQQAVRVAEAIFARRAGEVADRLEIRSKALNLVEIPEHLQAPQPVPHPFGGAGGRIPAPALSFGPDPSAKHAGGPMSVDGKDLQYNPKMIRLERDPSLVVLPDSKEFL